MTEFGQKEELTSRLSFILQEYPNGSQILKELIQNADDAKAVKVKIVLDHRTHGEKYLKYPGTKEFQGPALMIYNSGRFSATDFESIRNIGGSNKKYDCSKIGKFGIGFNSVYHLTDLPSILSGEDLVIFDPHEKYLTNDNNLPAAGIRINFLDQQYNVNAICDQISPFKLFGCTMSEPFNGTIFRLPLRTVEQACRSRISNNICDVESIRRVFSSFRSEAESILVFLKYVESIQLEEWFDGDLESTLFFEVKLNNFSDVRDCRSKIARSLECGSCNCDELLVPYQMDISLIEPESTVLLRWFVCNMMKYILPLKDRRIEWVGCAVMLSSDGLPVPVEGRAFCFLPLPITTGLPVHINGYFELSTNRRDLWSGSDIEGEGKLRVEWNNYIVTDSLPYVYGKLLESICFINTSQSDRIWWNIWPLSDYYEYFWQMVADNTLRNLWDRSVWWTSADGGHYCKGFEIVLYLEEDSKKLNVMDEVVNFLVTNSINLVSLNDKYLTVINKAVKNVTVLNPKYVREFMRNISVNFNWSSLQNSREVGLKILLYCLSDDNINDLQSLPLLPLKCGSFAKFEKNSENHAQFYIARSDEERVILEKLNNVLLDWDIPSILWEKLGSDDMISCYNIAFIDPMIISEQLHLLLPPRLLKISPIAWKTADYADERKWLQALWGYLSRENCDLQSYEGWPLLPCLEDKYYVLKKNQCSNYISQRDDVLDNTLSRLGCRVVQSTEFPLSHPQLENYVHRSTPKGIIRALKGAWEENPESLSYFGSIKNDEVEALLSCLASREFLSTVDSDDLEILHKLSLFRSWGSDDPEKYFSVDHRQMCIPTNGINNVSVLPDKYLFIRLSSGNGFEKELLRKLGIEEKSKTSFYIEYVFPKLAVLASEVRDSLMVQVMEELTQLNRENIDFKSVLSHLRFVPTNNQSTIVDLACPRDLYDPDNGLLMKLFNENRFPAHYFRDPVTLVALRALGLKTALTKECLLSCVREIAVGSDSGNSFSRSKTLLCWLNNNNDFCIQNTEATSKPLNLSLATEIQTRSWLPVKSEMNDATISGSQYPLPWKGRISSKFVNSLDMRPPSESLLVGATKLILDCDFTLSPELLSMLGWSSPPEAEAVVGQLHEAYKASVSYMLDRNVLHRAIDNVVDAVYSFLNDLHKGKSPSMPLIKQLLDHFPWVWTGCAFARSDDVAIRCSHDFSPYLHKLPISLTRFTSFLTQYGVQEEFGSASLLGLLKQVADSAEGNAINNKTLDTVIVVLDLLASESTFGINQSTLYVPTADCTMALSSDVVYNDAAWLDQSGKNVLLTNSKVSLHAARALGMTTFRERYLSSIDDESSLFDSIGESFGQHEPLTTRLSNLLNEYPEGPGILSELIQNADDAHATEFKILLDHSQYGKTSLLGEGMADWQGPALYVYNNAVFQPKDFENIIKLGGGAKKSDQDKIGKFGLGFNSVYHFTDVPSFVSGKYVVIFDPHCSHLPNLRPEASCGKRFNFVKRNILEMFPDQFSPYLLFGCDMRSYFNGTLFRFPLRTDLLASLSKIKISSYTFEKGYNMVNAAFRDMGNSLLLFLNNVENVSVSEKGFDITSSEVLHTVRVINVDSTIRNQSNFRSNMGLINNISTMKLHLEYEHGKSGRIQSTQWFVSKTFDNSSSTKQILKVGDENGLTFVPIGGAAVQLSLDGLPVPVEGRAFCFLPLPITTGLPVHINGYFELSTNRRDLWSGSDMQGKGKLRTSWNVFMVEHLLSNLYGELVEKLKDEKQCSGKTLWDILPLSNNYDKCWQLLADNTLRNLWDRSVWWTSAAGGRYCNGFEIVLYVEEEYNMVKCYNVTVNFLLAKGISLVKIPKDQLKALDDLKSININILSPHYTRVLIRGFVQSHDDNKIPQEIALELLSYCLTDNNFIDLVGVPLLPLRNGTFIAFENINVKHKVFITNSDEERVIMEKLSNVLVEWGISPDLWGKLCSEDMRSSCNIHIINPEVIANYMPLLLSPNWENLNSVEMPIASYPVKNWFKSLWKYLCNQNCDLQIFETFPLIPCRYNRLYRLINKPLSTLVFETEDALCNVLHSLGCGVVLSSEFTLSHTQLLTHYVHPPTPKGILKALRGVSELNADMGGYLDETSVELLLDFICQPSTINSLDTDDKDVLHRLNIFRTYENSTSDSFTRISKRQMWIPPSEINVSLLHQKELFIKLSNIGREKSLLIALGVVELNMADFYIIHIFPTLKTLSVSVRNELILRVLEELPCLKRQNSNIISVLCELHFVPRDTNIELLARPCELYDPTVSVLTSVLPSDKFPHSMFCTPTTLSALSILGLQSTLTADCCIQCIQEISNEANSENTSDENIYRAKLLLRWINEHFVIFKNTQKCIIKNKLINDYNESIRSYYWLPVKSEMNDATVSGSQYPLPWKGRISSKFANSLDMRPPSESLLVGATKLILDCDFTLSPELLSMLGWSSPPEAEAVVGQLHEAYKASDSYMLDRNVLHRAIDNVVDAVYSCLNDLHIGRSPSMPLIKQLLDHFPWVWTGCAFARSDDVAIRCSHDFSPYLHKLPISLTRFTSFLTQYGVQEAFGSASLLGLLKKVADSAEGNAINNKTLNTVIVVLDLLSTVPLRGKTSFNLYVPTADCTMALSSDVVYNDAPWLCKKLENPPLMIHDRVSKAVVNKFSMDSLSNRHLMFQSPVEWESIGEEFGQTESICTRIGNILKDYPDNGIIKEIIQNADDAGATVLKLLVDKRQHGTESVLSENMKSFQGPALCAYNNQPFNAEDIQSIQSLGKSSKNNEIEKIGQFGLGFNTVYHISDLPMLVTGDFMYIFDPHAKYAPGATILKPGRKLSLNGFVFEDQLAPFKWFGCNSGETFKETVFRFPLRTNAQSLISEIRRDPCSIDRIIQLLYELKQSSSSILLFLRSLKSIEVLVWERDAAEPNILFKTEAYYSDDHERNRKSLVSLAANPNYAVTIKDNLEKCTHQVRIRTLEGSTDIETNWLVTNVISIGEKTRIALEALGALEKKAIPFAGIALNLSDSAINKRDSSVFCFLPLPIRLPLPVHINSYFQLSSSRRNIWIGDERSGTSKCLTQWNQSLIGEALPRAYACALVEARNHFNISDAELYYSYWPSLDRLESLWAPIVEILYSILPKYELFAASSMHGRSWTSIVNVYFRDWNKNEIDRSPVYNYLLKEKPFEIVIQEVETSLLQITGFYLCNDLPPRILRELKKHIGKNLVKTTNVFDIRIFLRSNAKGMTLENAYILLPYCLADVRVNSNEEAGDKLLGLRLLPLASGELAVIGEKEFLLAPNNIINLFPNSCGHLFVSATIFEMFKHAKFEASFLQRIKLSHLEPKTFANLIKTHILPQSWKGKSVVLLSSGSGDSSLTLGWFTTFWDTIIDIGYKDMSCFNDLQLIPTQCGHCVAVEYAFSILSNNIASSKGKLLKNILIALGNFTASHSLTKKIPITYFSLNFEEICRMLRFSFERLDFSQLTKEQTNQLSEYLLFHSNEAKESDLNFMRDLPIFKDSRDEFVSIGSKTSIWRVVPSDANMTEITGNFLKYSLIAISYYIRCSIKILATRDFYLEVVIPELCSLSIEAKVIHLKKLRELVGIRDSIFMSSAISTNEDIIQKLCVLPFIPVSHCSYKAPKDLYDPTDNVLRLVFAGDDVFPQPPFDSPDWLQFLKMLGLSNLGNSNKIILKCANRIEKLSGDNKLAAAKEFAMHLVRLKDNEVSSLPQNLKQVIFFPAEFKESENVYAPSEISLACDKDLVGFVLPTSDMIPKSLKYEFIQSLGFLSPPPLEDVLKNWIVLASSTKNDNIDISSVVKTLHNIMIYCQRECLTHTSVIYSTMSSIPCIWLGTGFFPPSKIYLDLECEIPPYLYKVPKELLLYQSLLEACGVQKLPSFAVCSDISNKFCQQIHNKMPDINQRIFVEKITLQLTKSQDFDESKVKTVFLLDNKNVLRLGKELSFNDAEWLYLKIKAEEVYVANSGLPLPILQALPPLTTTVNEIFDTGFDPRIVPNSLSDIWTETISSKEFWSAIIQIYVCENPRHDETILNRLRLALKEISEYQIIFVEELKSKIILLSTGRDISGSMETTNMAFTDKANKLIYVVSSSGGELPPIFYVSREIKSLLGFNISYLERIIDCKPNKLGKRLSDIGIKETLIRPDPVVGEVLYAWDKRMMEDFESEDDLSYQFIDGEWIVWVDASENYRYGKIVREEVNIDASIVRPRLIRSYVVNTTGNEMKVISSATLWKLMTTDEQFMLVSYIAETHTSSDTSASDTYNRERSERRSMSLEEKLRKVKELIAEIWGLPKEEQNHAFRRLFLKWHPDKNQGDEVDCSEVFKYIQNELERGPLSSKGTSAPSSSSQQSGTARNSAGSRSSTSTTQDNNDRKQWWSNFNTSYNARRNNKSNSRRTSSSTYSQGNNTQCNHMCPLCCRR